MLNTDSTTQMTDIPRAKVLRMGRYMITEEAKAIGTRLEREQRQVPEYLNFQRELAASQDVTAFASLLAVAHWKLEGWAGLTLPLAGELKRIYVKAACYAVRFCSEVERQAATSRATAHGVARFDALQAAMRKQEATEDVRHDLIVGYIRECLDVQRHALMQGTVRSPLEMSDE